MNEIAEGRLPLQNHEQTKTIDMSFSDSVELFISVVDFSS